jgi:hypothetical protein
MPQIHLFHFNKAEVEARAATIESFGFHVDARPPTGPAFFKELRNNPPDVFVIDLSRLPSQGRDVGVIFRHSKSTRFVPLIFVEGSPEKIAKVKEQLPDAIYVTWEEMQETLQHALAHPVENPVVPSSSLAGYSGTPLPKKLGIDKVSAVGLVHAPEAFADTLGDVPPGVSLKEGASEDADILLWFLRSAKQLEQDVGKMVEHAEHARIWMIWPKKTSLIKSDLTQQHVREAGLAAGLVDYKVCAVDETWSGLLFTKKK